MNNSYLKKDLDIRRCGLPSVLLVALVHRVTFRIRRGHPLFSPRLFEWAIALAAHRFFPIFHFGYTLRNLVRKIKARLRG
ncbi:MAG TPA: hypothetical protein VMU21_07185 [Thermodesulfovibrionales bacterium]|nr:hypothetical protein [Thermodesulfovibrionales bacterium]